MYENALYLVTTNTENIMREHELLQMHLYFIVLNTYNVKAWNLKILHPSKGLIY